MRVTSNFNYLIFSNSLRKTGDAMARANEQIMTNKRVNRPSDDPAAMARILAARDDLSRIEQYKRNLATLDSQYTETETALADVSELLKRLKELSVQAGGVALNDVSRGHIADQVKQLGAELEAIANTQCEGKYIFAGYKLDTKPFRVAGGVAAYDGDAGVMEVEVGNGVTLSANIPGQEIFMGDGTPQTVDLFKLIADTETAILANNQSGPNGLGDQLNNITIAEGQISAQIGQIGAWGKRLETVGDTLEDGSLGIQNLVSTLEEANFPASISEFERAQTAFQAMIGSTAQMMQLPSLLNFIKG